jgi:hypothetical protein
MAVHDPLTEEALDDNETTVEVSSGEEIVATRRDPDAMLSPGKDMSTVLQTLEASGATLDRWQSKYGGMKNAKVKRHNLLENENRWPRSPLGGSVLREPEAVASF